MEETRKRVRNRWIAAVSFVILLMLVVGVGSFVNQRLKVPTVPSGNSLLTVSFPDGSSMDIIGISMEKRVMEIQSNRFSNPFLSGPLEEFRDFIGPADIHGQKRGEKVIRVSAHSKSPAGMLMEFRIKDKDGKGMVFPAYLVGENWVNQDNRLRMPPPPGEWFKPESMEIPDMQAAMSKAGLGVVFQYRDPDAGWIHLLGPTLLHAPWPDRYVTMMNVWRRDLPTLDLRVVRVDGQAAEFSVPNPDFRKSPVTKPPVVAIPYTYDASDFELTTTRVRRIPSLGTLPLIVLDLKLKYKGTPIPGLVVGPLNFRWFETQAIDEWGNQGTFTMYNIDNRPLAGVRLPLASTRLSVDMSLIRTTDYPRAIDSGYMILDGNISDDGSKVAFKLGKDAAVVGVKKRSRCEIKDVGFLGENNRIESTRRERGRQIELMIEGEDLHSEVVRKRIGEVKNCEIHIFLGERDQSSGVKYQESVIFLNDDSFEFGSSMKWTFPRDELAPGTRVRVTMDAPMRSEPIRLELELPAELESE